MKIPLSVLTASCLLAGASSATASVTLPARFDMGPTNPGDVAPGFIGVRATEAYDSNVGYGWTSGNGVFGVKRTAIPEQIIHNHPSELLIDFVRRFESLKFRVDLTPSQAYHCMVYLGDVDNAKNGMTVKANGTTVARGVWALTAKKKAGFANSYGGYRRISFLANADSNGTLEFEVEIAGTTVPVMGIEIYDATPPPLQFHHAASQIEGRAQISVTSGVTVDGSIQAGITHFNDGEYDDAVADFQQSSDKLARAWGNAFVVGSLTGHEEQVDMGSLDDPFDNGLLGDILDDLSGLDMNDSAVRSLYVEGLDLQRGVLFNRTRAYSTAAFPNPDNLEQSGLAQGPGEDSMVLNLSAAMQLLEQMSDDVLKTGPDVHATESPFYPTAQYLIGRNLYGRNTQVSTGGINADLAMVEYLMEVLVDRLWPVLDPQGGRTLYPDAHEATLLSWTMSTLAIQIDFSNPPNPVPEKLLNAGVVQAWHDAQKPTPPINPVETWWNADVHPSAASGVPSHASWTEGQRELAFQVRNAARWWVENRLRDGELGGGPGDDVEFSLLAPLTGRRESRDNPWVEAPLSRVWDDSLFHEPQVSTAEGYAKLSGDVEHSAELTTLPLGILVPMNFGNPRYYNFMMLTMRNMADFHQAASNSPNAWTTRNLGGVFEPIRHFHSWKIGGTEPPGNLPSQTYDVPLTMKAILPGLSLLDFNQSPTLQGLFEDYAWAWRDAAMRTDNNKPVGFFPGAVFVDANGAPGSLGILNEWWVSDPFGYDLPGGAAKRMMGQIYQLLTEVSRTSSSTNAAQLLEPLKAALLTTPDETAAEGTAGWAASQLSNQIADAAFAAREDLLQLAGITAADIDPWIEDYASDMQAFLFENQSQSGATNKADFEQTFDDGALFLRYFWPFATTTVSYTDRLRLDYDSTRSLFSSATVGALNLSPNFVTTWDNADSGPDALESDRLDIAILTNRYVPTASGQTNGLLEVLLYNFKGTTSTLDLRIWRGLGTGDYDVQIGEAGSNDDFLSPPTPTTFSLDRKGANLPVDVPPNQLTLLRLTQKPNVIPTPNPYYDLAIASSGALIDKRDRLHITVSNLGLNDYPITSGGIGIPATIEVRVNGALVESKTLLKNLPAPENSPSGLDPTIERIVFSGDFSQYSPGDLVTIELTQVAGVQITTANDVAEILYEDIPRL